MRMFIAANWQDRSEMIDVTNPFNGEVIDTVPRGTAADVEAALATLVDGARVMRAMPAAERCRMLQAAVRLAGWPGLIGEPSLRCATASESAEKQCR